MSLWRDTRLPAPFMTYVSREPRLAACIHCGEPFIASTLARKYCSNSCNVLASNARKRAREAAAIEAATLAAAAPPPVVEAYREPDILLPRRLLRLASPVRALEEPRELHPMEAVERAPWSLLVQKYRSAYMLNWLHMPSGRVYTSQYFWAGENGSVWVEDLPDSPERLRRVEDLVQQASKW